LLEYRQKRAISRISQVKYNLYVCGEWWETLREKKAARASASFWLC
jgi:hypothetical protein